MAAVWNRVESLKVLIDSGADCDLKNSHSEVARDVAARYGNRSCTNYLDSAGVCPVLSAPAVACVDLGAVHVLYNALQGGRGLTVCYMRYMGVGVFFANVK